MVFYANRSRYARRKEEAGLAGKLKSFFARASM